MEKLDPEPWGSKKDKDRLVPVQTDLPPAPDEQFEVIRCNWQTDCSSFKCSCKMQDMKFCLACGNCRGSSCSNSSHFACKEDNFGSLY